MAQHLLKLFTQESFKATEEDWKKGKATATFPTESEQLLEWVRTHMVEIDSHDAIAYGVFPDGANIAEAVCEVVISRQSTRSKWVKMLRLRLNPVLDERIYNEDLDAYRHVLFLYAASVAGVLKLKNVHEATTLKIFGRSQEQVSFLRQLALLLSQEKRIIKKHSIKMAGRWLVIENI